MTDAIDTPTFHDRIEQYAGKRSRFEDVVVQRSRRADLHAFLLLDELLPGTGDIVSAAAHDVIYLGVDVDELNKIITESQLQELVHCGVCYDSSHDSLYLFT